MCLVDGRNPPELQNTTNLIQNFVLKCQFYKYPAYTNCFESLIHVSLTILINFYKKYLCARERDMFHHFSLVALLSTWGNGVERTKKKRNPWSFTHELCVENSIDF